MSKIYEVQVQEDKGTYRFDSQNLGVMKEAEDESATYIEVLSFLRDIFKLVDFSSILKNSSKHRF